MFLRGPVAIHLKSVVAYHKNLGKCPIFLAQSLHDSLKGLGHAQGMSAVKMQRPPHHPFKCPGMHCSYSCGQTHGSPGKY